MFTDNKDFYPTPKNIISKMFSNIDFSMLQYVLEPSAGDGNIIDYLKEKEKINKYSYTKYNFDIDCIEHDTRLISILKDKNYRVVHNDFLTYNTMKKYDLIVMNPPFSNGCKHLLKALEMQEKTGGAVICLLNAETLKNAYTNERKALLTKLEQSNAVVEYIQEAFVAAERITDVEVALIKIKFPEIKNESFIFSGLKKDKEQKEIEYTENNQIIGNDFIKTIIEQYDLEVNAGIKLINEYHALSPYILSDFSVNESEQLEQTGGCILKLDMSSNRDAYRNKLSINEYIKEVRKKYWTALFNNQEFIGKLTGNLKRDFFNRIDDLKNYDFTLYNILELKIEMSKKVVSGIEETIINLFDELSHKHYWDQDTSSNIHYYNGWKTNKSWIINKKVIIPLNAYNGYGTTTYNPTWYTILEKLQDIEKCFNYLDGGITEAVDIKESLEFAKEFEETKNIQLKYFNITFYKKGTCHIVFDNEELLKKFNIYGSMKKGWLPNGYGSKKYKDMSKEEKEVVNSFEGEKEYQKVLNRNEYYIFNANNCAKLEQKTA